MSIKCSAEFGSAPSVTDSAMAASFAIDNPDAFRYSPALGWFRWTGKVWEPLMGDDVVVDRLRQYNKKAAVRHAGGDIKLYMAVAHYLGAGAIRRQLLLLRAMEPVRVDDPEAFDNNRDLLNVQNGVLDLRTGDLTDHSPSLLMTRIASAAYDPQASHSDWDKALEALGDMDDETKNWVQVVLGSGCSGQRPSDDLNPILQGGGENGKSTVLVACQQALGSYAAVVPDSVLSSSNDHPTGLTEFRGLRLAVMEETPEEMKLNIQVVKKLSSGNEVQARRMRQDYFKFTPSHTLVVATNHKPLVRETDRGTWRRLALVPFTKTFGSGHGEAPVDRGLRGRLEGGKDGRGEAVLAWLVRGCMGWYAGSGSLKPLPKAIDEATRAWRNETDVIALFAEDCLEFGPGLVVAKSEVWERFRTWCQETSVAEFKSSRTLTTALLSHELASANKVAETRGTGGSRLWTGFRVLPSSIPAYPGEPSIRA